VSILRRALRKFPERSLKSTEFFRHEILDLARGHGVTRANQHRSDLEPVTDAIEIGGLDGRNRGSADPRTGSFADSSDTVPHAIIARISKGWAREHPPGLETTKMDRPSVRLREIPFHFDTVRAGALAL